MSWLRRHVALLVLGVTVVATLVSVAALELAVNQHHDRLLEVRVTMARTDDGIAGVFGEAQDVINGTPAPQLGYERSVALRTPSVSWANVLRRQWSNSLSRQAASSVIALDNHVEQMLALARGGQAKRAAAMNAAVVIPDDGAAKQALARAAAGLNRQTNTANSIQVAATLGGAAGACLILLIMMRGVARAGRRKDLAESERHLIREAEKRLRALVQNSSDVILVVASDGTILYEAGSAQTVLGHELEELHGTRITALAEADDAARLLSLCNTDGREDAEVRIRHPRGSIRACEIRATSLLEDPSWNGVVLHIWDVSDRKELELELRLAQKLEAVGQLAAGIAHEINTPIQYVGDTSRFLDNAFAELIAVLDAHAELLAAARDGTITPELLERVGEAEETADVEYLRERIPQACERTVDGVHRVSKIVKAMRAFAHPPSLETSCVDINEGVRNTAIVATNEYKYVAELTTNLGELPLIECNAGDINQVLLNLIVNAAQAVADKVGDSGERGSIHVRTWATADDVFISVSDTGGGIPKDVALRIFDPFFTTKEVGRGTGQGLTLSRTIVVERHGGSLTFETRPGQGTTFFVRLPARIAGAIGETAAAA